MSAHSMTPIVAVGAVVFHKGKVLLVRRAQPPNEGQWAIPGGKINIGETLQQAAEREIDEETGILIRAGKPIFVFDLIEHDDHGSCHRHYVIIDLLGEYLSGEPHANDDASDARWFSAQDLISHPVNKTTLSLLKPAKRGDGWSFSSELLSECSATQGYQGTGE